MVGRNYFLISALYEYGVGPLAPGLPTQKYQGGTTKGTSNQHVTAADVQGEVRRSNNIGTIVHVQQNRDKSTP